jgi:hypothetical protein
MGRLRVLPNQKRHGSLVVLAALPIQECYKFEHGSGSPSSDRYGSGERMNQRDIGGLIFLAALLAVPLVIAADLIARWWH